MARITGQKGNPGAKSIHRRIVRASLVSMPGWAWNLSISVGRDLRDPPAQPSLGAQICSALAHTPAWLQGLLHLLLGAAPPPPPPA